MNEPSQAPAQPPADYAELLQRLIEAEDTLYAIRTGDVDALMMGVQIYSLEGAETPYRLLIEAMGEGAGTLALDGTVLYANRRLSEILAAPLPELIGNPLLPWMAPADQALFTTWLNEGQHHPVIGRLSLLKHDGQTVPMQVSINLLPAPGTPSLGIVLVDLTAINQAEEALRRSNRALRMVSACDHVLVHAATEAVLFAEICQAIISEGGYPLAWVGVAEHDAAKTIKPLFRAGIKRDYLENIPLSWAAEAKVLGPAGKAIQSGETVVVNELMSDAHFDPWRERALAAGFAASIALPLITETGIWGVLCIYAQNSGAFNGEEVQLLKGLANDLAYGITTFRNQAEHEQAEAKIRELNEELEQRVRLRTTELEASNTELEAFVYTVAHDLRAPLRSIDGFSRILLEDCGERLNTEEKGHLERVRTATQHMGHLIESMLQLSRLNRSELRRTTVNISALAQGVFADLQRQDPDRRVTAVVAPDLVAQADPALIHSVLENLLGNAWKFTSKTAEARIELGCSKQDSVPTFFVHDNGAGFNMAYRGKLFGVFQRLHRNDEFPGTGVGLASVQRIIHRHQGRVWAESEPGNGASFFFTLEPTTKHHE
jgi:PAS domain S-box-containing protein